MKIEEKEMQEIKKELTEMKELVSKLLELQMFDHKMKYGYMTDLEKEV